MDSLLAGTLILPWKGHCAGYDVQRRRAVKNIPGIAKTIPGLGENCSPSRRNRCSPSARNPIHLHPGIVFAFTPESRSPCPGIRNVQGDVRLRVRVAEDGTVQDINLVSGPPQLVGAAIAAVRQWKYQPVISSGHPVAVVTIVTVPFRLPFNGK